MTIAKKILSLLFIVFIVTVSLSNIFADDIAFSEQENRILSQKPQLKIKSLFSGKYMSDFETYLSDQFIGKTIWISIKAMAEQMILKKELNGIYIGDDGYLFEKYKKPDEQFERNLQYVAQFADGRNVSLLLVPTSIEMYQERLPLFAPTYSQEKVVQSVDKLSAKINFISTFQTLKEHKDELIYFKTDHHWTMRGAYYAYKEAAKILGFTPYALDDFQVETVSKNFLGTYAAKALEPGIQPDNIEVYKPTFLTAYKVRYEDKNQASDSLYHWDSLEKRDQYSLFLNGNHSLVTIQSHVKNRKKLVVIKDSYAHAFIPFLANHYEEIHILDLRYFHASLKQYLQENELNDILLLYNIPNFTVDSNLIWLTS